MKKLVKSINSKLKSINRKRLELKQYDHLRKILKNAKREHIINKTIVFNTVKTNKSFIDREFFLGKILALNGANVIMLLDDGALYHWESPKTINTKIYKSPIPNYFRRRIIKKALKTYRDKNLRVLFYSKILDKNNINIENWEALKKFAKASTIRLCSTSELDFSNKKTKYYYITSLKNAVLNRYVGDYILNEIKPDLFITSHGIYSIWGPIYEMLRDNGVKSLVFKRSHPHTMDHRDVYFNDAVTQLISRSTLWKNYENTPVSEEMEIKIRKYFNQRLAHKTKDTRLHFDGGLGKTFEVNKNDGYKYHIAMFPNVIWDGNIEERHTAFDSYIDWLISTVNYVKNRKDIKLYVKAHPAETILQKDTQSSVAIIKNRVDLKNVENIVFIPANKKINPYNLLMSGIDLGIVYDGFLGLEMPFLKIPVIVCVKGGKFSVEGGNLTISNKEDYFHYLDNIEKVIAEFHNNYEKYYKNIVRYAYWYLFENVIKLPILSKVYRGVPDVSQLKEEDLKLDEKLLELLK